jgi:hypothetical protein
LEITHHSRNRLRGSDGADVIDDASRRCVRSLDVVYRLYRRLPSSSGVAQCHRRTGECRWAGTPAGWVGINNDTHAASVISESWRKSCEANICMLRILAVECPHGSGRKCDSLSRPAHAPPVTRRVPVMRTVHQMGKGRATCRGYCEDVTTAIRARLGTGYATSVLTVPLMKLKASGGGRTVCRHLAQDLRWLSPPTRGLM